MSATDPYIRIGALTEALEWTEKALEGLLERDRISREAIEDILFSVRRSLQRSRSGDIDQTLFRASIE